MKEDMLKRRAQILEGKKTKRNKLLQQRRAAGVKISDSEFEKEVDFDVEKVEIAPLSEKHSMVQIHTGKLQTKPNKSSHDKHFPIHINQSIKLL